MIKQHSSQDRQSPAHNTSSNSNLKTYIQDLKKVAQSNKSKRSSVAQGAMQTQKKGPLYQQQQPPLTTKNDRASGLLSFAQNPDNSQNMMPV